MKVVKLFLIAVIVGIVAGCKETKEKPVLSIESDSLIFSAEGENKTFNVTTNVTWTITGHETVAWISSVIPASGNDNATIDVMVDANPSAVETRSAELILTAQGVTPVKVSINQEKMPEAEIISFTPTSAAYGATLTIIGKNFSAVKTENTVQFNGHDAEILSATTTEMQVTVPKNLQCSGKVSVTVGGVTAVSAADFTYLPSIYESISVEPESLTFSAEGENKTFDVTTKLTWTITGHETVTWITSIIPVSGNDNATVSVTVDANPSAVETRSAELILSAQDVTPVKVSISQEKMPEAEITFFTPASAAYDATLTITGKNFSAVKNENIVKFNGHDVEVISATTTEIQVTVPKNLQCSGKVSVMVGGVTAISAADFTYLPTITVSTLAGRGTDGFVDGNGTAAQFSYPTGVAVDVSGNIYVADGLNHNIRKITPEGVVSTLAGNRTAGFADGIGTAAKFSYPYNVTTDALYNIYVGDFGNNRIRKISPEGMVSTFAGSGTYGFVNGASTAAQFNYIRGIAVDVLGNMYVADENNHSIRKISPEGVVSTFAGNGIKGFVDGASTVAQFSHPLDVAVDAIGNIYVADLINQSIRKINKEGMVSTLAGNGTEGFADGVGTAARFSHPSGVAVDAIGNVYVADMNNNSIRIISPEGMVSTLAGNGTWGSTDGAGAVARFSYPSDVTVDALGIVYVADSNSRRIRKIVIE